VFLHMRVPFCFRAQQDSVASFGISKREETMFSLGILEF
jgi:hypothetical protein